MRTSRHAWWLAGLVAGVAGLATSYFVAMVMTIRESPVVAVAELIIKLTPGAVIEPVIRLLGHHDKAFLVTVLLIVLGLLFAWAGRLARTSTNKSLVLFVAVAVLGGIAITKQYGAQISDLLPIFVGFITWVVALSVLTSPLRAAQRDARRAPPRSGRRDGEPEADDLVDEGPPRRGFLIGAGLMVAVSGAVALTGRALGRGRRKVEEARRLLRLPGVTAPVQPAGATVDLPGITPWRTPSDKFYLIHTALIAPAIDPAGWKLRIHGMVDHEIVLTYADLMKRKSTQGWITLNCVSNPVGGPLIGNAWWSGVRLADLLAEAGVRDGADAVLQTSQDGWTCGTPVAALTDDRNAMLAVAMNGAALPIEHGFPVRTLVPGLYGYVSACKWVVDMEVTRFDDISAYWTGKGWSEQAPVKMSSRIDVPGGGDTMKSGEQRVGGVAWSQHTGIKAVEVSLDGGAWQSAELSNAETIDSWVQWSTTLTLEGGDHVLRVRATDNDGLVQTGVEADVLPDGATGWHTVQFSV